MSSSRNRFAAPAEAPSSSKGQEAEKPDTGSINKGDQTMQDTPQAGTSISMEGLTQNPPKVWSHAENVAIVRKMRAEIEARNREDGRAKKLRQGKGSAFVNPRTIPSAAPDSVNELHQGSLSTLGSKANQSSAPSLGRRKRTASSEEEEPSKRQRMVPLSPSQTAGEPPITTPTNGSDRETNDPGVVREGTPTPAIVQNDPFLPAPSSFDWHDIRMPKRALRCIVQANDSTKIGSFAKDTEDWAFLLTFDADRWKVPTMTMKFFSDGTKGPPSAETGWCLGEWMEGDWMVTDFKVHRVADCAEPGKIRNRDILAACKTEEEKARLICIRLEAWPKILRRFNENYQRRNPQPGTNELFSAVLTGRRPYHLRIWFVAPGDLETFEKQCLSIFTIFFQRRKPVYDGICDARGVGFDL